MQVKISNRLTGCFTFILSLLIASCGSIGETVDVKVPDVCQSSELTDAFEAGIKNYLTTGVMTPQLTDDFVKYSGQAQNCFQQGHIAAYLFSLGDTPYKLIF